MGFPIGDLFSIRSFLIAGVQTCQLFENDLMASSIGYLQEVKRNQILFYNVELIC